MKTNTIQKEIPSGWKKVSLSDIVDVKMGQSPSSSAYNKNGVGLPLIQGNNDIKEGKTIDRIWTTEITKTADKGDIILTVRAPVGAVGIAHKKICIGRGVCTIKSDKHSFVWHYLKYFEPKWGNLEQGSTFTAVNSTDIKKIKLNFPPLPEQNRIVSVLETWDKAIEKLNKKIELKKRIKEYLMIDLLLGKKRLSGFKNKWQTVEIGDLLNYEQPTKYIVNDTDYHNDYKIPVLTANKGFILGCSNETNGIYKSIPVIIFDDFTMDNKFVNFAFKIKSSAIKILTPKNKDVNLKFIFERIQLVNIVIGEHRRHYLSEYQYLTIDTPELKEQNAIENILTIADKEIMALKKKLTLFQDQKKYLLNNLITGNIRTPETLKININ